MVSIRESERAGPYTHRFSLNMHKSSSLPLLRLVWSKSFRSYLFLPSPSHTGHPIFLFYTSSLPFFIQNMYLFFSLTKVINLIESYGVWIRRRVCGILEADRKEKLMLHYCLCVCVCELGIHKNLVRELVHLVNRAAGRKII